MNISDSIYDILKNGAKEIVKDKLKLDKDKGFDIEILEYNYSNDEFSFVVCVYNDTNPNFEEQYEINCKLKNGLEVEIKKF